MGQLLSRSAKKTATKKVERGSAPLVKVLLLGPGESGKSTLFKQVTQLYGGGLGEAYLDSCRFSIHNSMVQSMKALCAASTSPKLSLANFHALSPEFWDHMHVLWTSTEIQQAWQARSGLDLPETISIFFDDIPRVSAPGYTPTHDDVVNCRVRTNGIREVHFQVRGVPFHLLDVGGQRNERKKWIHCFEGVEAVVFVVAINEYDQVCFEDKSTNRLTEALELFDSVCNNEAFSESSIVLFLNKQDLFLDKLQKTDLSDFFPDYTGGNDYSAAVEFVAQKFINLDNRDSKIELVVHLTCATNRQATETTFGIVCDAVQTAILADSMVEVGLY